MTRAHRYLNSNVVTVLSVFGILLVIIALALSSGEARRILLGVAVAATLLINLTCDRMRSAEMSAIRADHAAQRDRLNRHVATCPNSRAPSEVQGALHTIPSRRSRIA